MSKELSILDKKLPAHIKVLATDAGEVMDEWGSGTVSGFPVISIDGKRFTIRRGGEDQLVTRKDEDGEDIPAQSLQTVVLRSNKGVARTFYKEKYVQGSDDAPSCYSNDGFTPEPDSENRQAKKCAICKQAQWGSRITEQGKKGKACSEVKRLAVVPAQMLNDPMLVRIPPTSLKVWDKYVELLSKRGLNPTQVITKISFNNDVSHQVLVFKPVGFVTDDMVPELQETLQDNILETIIGGGSVADPDADLEDEEEVEEEETAPPPKKKPVRKKKAAEVIEEEDDEEEDDAEDEEEEEAPPPKKKPARKKKPKPAPVEEEEDEEEEDEEEEEAPPPKKKPVRKKKPAAKKKPVVEEETDDDDDGLDGLEALDFSDIDFGDEDDD